MRKFDSAGKGSKKKRCFLVDKNGEIKTLRHLKKRNNSVATDDEREGVTTSMEEGKSEVKLIDEALTTMQDHIR